MTVKATLDGEPLPASPQGDVHTIPPGKTLVNYEHALVINGHELKIRIDFDPPLEAPPTSGGDSG